MNSPGYALRNIRYSGRGRPGGGARGVGAGWHLKTLLLLALPGVAAGGGANGNIGYREGWPWGRYPDVDDCPPSAGF